MLSTAIEPHFISLVVICGMIHIFTQSGGILTQLVDAVTGTEQYNIPVALCKRPGVGQWYYGKEAVKALKHPNKPYPSILS